MDGPPVPKPRTGLGAGVDPSKRPIPLPRRAATPTIPAVAEKHSTMDKLRSIGISSKQLTEEVAYKVQNRAKSATEKIEKSLQDSSKLATGTIERTKSVTKSLFDGTNRMWKTKKNNSSERERCVSMPPVDMSLFDKIKFKSPLQDQATFGNVSDLVLDARYQEGTNCILDHLSLLSSNSGSMADTTSNASFEELNIDPTYDTPTSSKTNSIVGTPTIPELPVRHSVKRSISYENWKLPKTTEPLLTSTNECSSELRQSTILEFDPLSGTSTKYEGLTNGQLLEFQEFLNFNDGDDFSLMPDNEYSNSVISTTPPEPPTRVDSIETKAELTLKKNTDWYVDLDHTEGDKTRIVSSPSGGPLDKLKGIFAPSKTQKAQDGQTCIVAKPAVSTKLVYHSGMLTRISSGAEELFKNSPSRYCVLSNQEIVCYTDTVNGNVKERYSLDSINSVQHVLPLSTSTFNFELSISPGPVQAAPRKLVFSTNSNIDRRLWTQKIVEHFTDAFPAKWAAEFTRCGWCYLKEGVGGEWQGNWVMLVRRELVYIRDGAVHTIDLRKARCIVTREADDETRSQCPSDDSHNLLLDCPGGTIYLRFPHDKELKNWSFNVIRSAHSNGQQIHHQQLTRDNVPTIVDKCISFIYAHGTMSEGIYRHGGRDSQLSSLLQQFRRDAWAVQLTPGGGYSEHDVAGVLKRFFRELTVPLLPPEMHGALVDALAITDDATRHSALRRLMGSLPLVAGATARKLFSHLRFLHLMEPANKMSAENLAKVWTPNVMPCVWNNEASQIAWSSKLCYVVLELIKNYVSIWQPSAEEMRTEEHERRLLLRTGTAPAAARVGTRGGQIRVWVYVRDKSNSYHLTLDPAKSAEDICVELCARASAEPHALMLQEVICGDSLRRVVHGSELVLDVVLRWGYWDEKDRKDNYLIVTGNRLLHDMEALRGSTSLVCGELKFANQLSKSFKQYMFDFQHGKLSYYKDKQGAVKLEEWNIKKIVWYMGHESERNPQTRWAITFIPRGNKPKRSKERPWFGCTIAGAVNEDRLKWMTAMMLAEHSAILPTPRLIIT